jgi:Reversibly glycosylated polypeptide
MIVVIPSCRTIRLDYLTPLIEAGARFIIVDDSEGRISIDHPQFQVYNWSHQRRMLGKLEAAIPRRNGSCRDFGFYVAWLESSDDEIIIALDDDCIVEDSDFAGQVKHKLSGSIRRTSNSRGPHLNILDLYSNPEKSSLFPRGFPYSQRVAYKRWPFDEEISANTAFNLGLWKGVFDINAIDKLSAPIYVYPDATLASESVVVPQRTLVSVCSMNMQFRRALIPAVYQLPMHVNVMPGWGIDRYGDIWGGFILKTLMDIRGDRMSVGGPLIRHVKEGDYLENIRQEHLCHLINDEFIQMLDRARERIKPGSYLDMMTGLREEFLQHQSETTPILEAYLQHFNSSLGCWITALGQNVG